MARPDLDDGFLRYAHELDAALACADFTKGARIVLREVFSQVFGPARSRVAKVFPSELARACGGNKAHLCRAVRELTDSGVLKKVDECEYVFVKDYERWTKGGSPRLSMEEVAYARTAPGRAMSYKRSSGANPVNGHASNREACGASPVNETVPESAPRCQSSQRVGANPVNASVPQLAPFGANPVNDAHYVEPARIETGDLGDKRERGPAPPLAFAALGPEYTEVGNLAIDLGDDINWGPWVSKMGRIGYPAAWIRDVVTKMAGRDEMDMALGYGILKRYQKQGGPDKPKGFVNRNENNGKTAVQQRPEETRAKLARPDLPRTPQFAGVNRYWDDIEAGRTPNPKDLAI